MRDDVGGLQQDREFLREFDIAANRVQLGVALTGVGR